MNFRSEESSDSTRPIQASMWINENESTMATIEVITSKTITGVELQTDLSSEISNGLRRSSREGSFVEEEFAQKDKALS